MFARKHVYSKIRHPGSLISQPRFGSEKVPDSTGPPAPSALEKPRSASRSGPCAKFKTRIRARAASQEPLATDRGSNRLPAATRVVPSLVPRRRTGRSSKPQGTGARDQANTRDAGATLAHGGVTLRRQGGQVGDDAAGVLAAIMTVLRKGMQDEAGLHIGYQSNIAMTIFEARALCAYIW